jgi:hypothetical protein
MSTPMGTNWKKLSAYESELVDAKTIYLFYCEDCRSVYGEA